MTKLIEDLAAELIRQAYAEGYAQGKFDAEMEGQFEKVKRVVEETPQAKRDRIVEQAKRDIEELMDSYYGLYIAGPFVCKAEFIVNKDKRTVVALLRGKRSGRVRKKGIAKCAPGDCFNVWIGKAIALRRALGLDIPFDYLTVPNPTEVRVGDVIISKRVRIPRVVKARDPKNDSGTYGKAFKTTERPGWIGERQMTIIDDSREEGSE